MAVLGKRNRYLIIAQSIISLVLLLAFLILSMGNVISLPTDRTENMDVHTEDFYLTYQSTTAGELGDTVDFGFLSLWEGTFELISPAASLILHGQSFDELSAESVSNSKEILFLSFLTAETFVSGLYEGIAFGILTLYLMLCPIFLFVCLLVGLISFLTNLKKLRKAYLRATRCLALGIGSILMLFVILFYTPECTEGPMMPALFWTLTGAFVFFIVFSQVKYHSKHERGFLIFSQFISVCSFGACATMLWSARKAGFIATLYEQLNVMDGIEFFKYVWEGNGDIAAVLAFLIVTVSLVCLCTSFPHLFQSSLRLCCLFNTKEKKKHDFIFQYSICCAIALLVYLFLLTASSEYHITLSDEETVFYAVSCAMAFLILIVEVLYYVLGYFWVRIDMTTKLEVLSGYAENRLTMDKEALQMAISTPDDDMNA